MPDPRSAIMVSLLLFASVASAQEPLSPLTTLVRTLAKIENPAAQASILRGMNAALKGRTDLSAPEGWAQLQPKLSASPSAEVRDLARALGAAFGDPAVLEEMRRTLADAAAPAAARLPAIEMLAARRDAAALPALLEIAKRPGTLRAPALRALAGYDDPGIAPALLASFATFNTAEKRDALSTLLGRAATARALLVAIDSGAVPRGEITAPLARQLQGLHDAEIDAWLAKSWGSVRTTSAGKQALIAKYKSQLDAKVFTGADVHRGRALFAQACAACHTLFGTGGKIGPELPGAFEDIDYLLQNILDPNAIIGKDYQQTFLTLRDGQVLSGILAGDDGASVTLRTLSDPVTIPRERIAEMKVSELSMMPEGLLDALDEPSVRDLFLYLRQKQQVPLLATAMNANDFFNGADLTRWRPSSAAAWKVEGGAILGRSSEARPQSLLSEMLADAFRFTAEIQVTGENAAAEIIVRGRHGPNGFAGASLSVGGSTPANVWHYEGRDAKPESKEAILVDATKWVPLEIVARGEKTDVWLSGKIVATIHSPQNLRTAFAFYIASGELRVRQPRLEIVAK